MFIRIIILLALFLMEIGVTAYFLIKKRIRWFVAVIIFFALVALVAGFLVVPAGRVFFNIPVLTTRGAADLFIDSVNRCDTNSESYLLREQSALYRQEECGESNAEYLRQMLMSNVRLELTAEPEMGWDSAIIRVRVSFPDVTSQAETVAEDAVREAEKIGAERPRSLVYSADRRYLPEIIDEVYSARTEKLTPADFTTVSGDVELSAICENGDWKIVSDEGILSMILGIFPGSDSVAEALDAFTLTQKQTVADRAKYIQKHYTIDFSDTVAPEPDISRYGATEDPAEVQAVVEKAAELLQGQELVWNPDIEIFPGTQIEYYFDDTILAIVWREASNGTVSTFAEVKIADASQLRRKLVDDCFDPPTSDWLEATVLSDEVNAVVATGSDLYAFRNLGIFSYDGVLYRCLPNFVESCHITRSGDMLFTHRYELMDWDEAQQWITDNDIMFSLAFGPVLVENGDPVYTGEYCIGEIWDGYARAAMGQIGKPGSLHYLMTVMSSDTRIATDELPARRDPILLEIRDLMVEKGCSQAYALDGGQTGAIIINNEMITRPTYGWERIYCDILYFATALTPEERLG